MATLLEKATVWMWAEEPNYRAPLRATGPGTLAAHAAVDDNGERFTATGAGSTTTTVATAVLTEATAAGYVGCLLRCVAVATPATNGQNVGIVVLVRSFSAAGDTLTHTAFPAATAAGDQFELIDVDVRVVETAGGSSAQVDSALRAANSAEPDDFWNGYSLIAESTTNTPQGTVVPVTDFVNATGRSVAALSGASVIGDSWWLRKFPKLWGPPVVSFKQDDLERPAARGDCGEEQTIPGQRSWESEWTLPIKGSGTAAGAGVVGVAPPEAAPALRSIFATATSTGDTVVAASGTAPALSTTSFNVATGNMTRFPVGSIVHDNAGRTAVVTAQAANGADPDSLTIRPALNRTPIAGEVMRGGYAYSPQVTGHKTMTLDCWLGSGLRWIGYGGIPTFKITDIGRGKVPKMVFGYRGGFWFTYASTKPTVLVASQDTVVPRSSADCYAQVALEGSNTVTRLVIDDGSIDFGHELVEESGVSLVDGIFGGRLTNTRVRFQFTCHLDTAAPNDSHGQFLNYQSSRVLTLHVQLGQEPGKTWTFYAHRASYTFPDWPVENGLRRIVLKGMVLASELTSMPKCLMGWT